jgi:hypothetical protein
MRSLPHPHRLLLGTAAAAALLIGCSDDTGDDGPGPLDTQEQAPTTVASTVPGASPGDGGSNVGGDTGTGSSDGDRQPDEIPDANTPDDPDAPTGGAGVDSSDEWRSETDGDLDG